MALDIQVTLKQDLLTSQITITYSNKIVCHVISSVKDCHILYICVWLSVLVFLSVFLKNTVLYVLSVHLYYRVYSNFEKFTELQFLSICCNSIFFNLPLM